MSGFLISNIGVPPVVLEGPTDTGANRSFTRTGGGACIDVDVIIRPHSSGQTDCNC